MSTKLSALTAVSGALNPASLILVNDADEGTASARSKSATIRQVVSPLRVSTVAALRALSVANYQTGDLVTVLGYYSAGDGGGGNFTFNSSSSTTDDNGTVLAPNSGSGRWLRVFNGDTVELDWFGCVGDGVTDDRVNVQRALDWAAARTRATVNIGNRTYALGNYLTLNSNYTAFIGRGQNYSRFLLTSANNDFLRVGNIAGPSISIPTIGAFAVDRNQVPTGGTGLSLIKTALAKVFDIHVNGCQNGFYFTSATNSNIRRCLASCGTTGVNFIGFHWDGGQTGTTLMPPASSTMTSCIVDATGCSGTSFGLKLDGNCIADLYTYDFGTLRCSYSRYIDGSKAVSAPVIAANSASYNWDVKFFNSTDDEFKVHGLYISGNTGIGAITDTATWTNPASSAGTGSGIYVQNSRGVSIDSPQIMNIGKLATARGITIDASTNVSVRGGRIIDLNYGVYVLSGSLGAVEGVTIYNQSSASAATSILLSGGTRFKVVNNIIDGYSSVGISSDSGSGCAKNLILGNHVNPTNVATPIVATGTGDVSANNIIT